MIYIADVFVRSVEKTTHACLDKISGCSPNGEYTSLIKMLLISKPTTNQNKCDVSNITISAYKENSLPDLRLGKTYRIYAAEADNTAERN